MYKSFGGALGVQKLNSATALIQRHERGSLIDGDGVCRFHAHCIRTRINAQIVLGKVTEQRAGSIHLLDRRVKAKSCSAPRAPDDSKEINKQSGTVVSTQSRNVRFFAI